MSQFLVRYIALTEGFDSERQDERLEHGGEGGNSTGCETFNSNQLEVKAAGRVRVGGCEGCV